jgi:hypothetical protein
MFEVEVDNNSGYFLFLRMNPYHLNPVYFCYQCPYYVVVLDGG